MTTRGRRRREQYAGRVPGTHICLNNALTRSELARMHSTHYAPAHVVRTELRIVSFDLVMSTNGYKSDADANNRNSRHARLRDDGVRQYRLDCRELINCASVAIDAGAAAGDA
ncbi:hypothetical protein EVAR_89561_1 [Eumeta japonica]|uniref:Uncharacterized protein n=1 Tax=Eumeta variegata TaxID=151549 RepID=A0A4C1YP25_EUMVA|nr:hypothetical protein EVAR_89561_1 [Eumeta japonica]